MVGVWEQHSFMLARLDGFDLLSNTLFMCVCGAAEPGSEAPWEREGEPRFLLTRCPLRPPAGEPST